MKLEYIYKLVDPRDKQVKYVGKTNNPDARRRQVKRPAMYNYSVKGWIKELKNEGLEPEFIVVESCRGDGKKREKHWIEHYAKSENELLNRRGVKFDYY